MAKQVDNIFTVSFNKSEKDKFLLSAVKGTNEKTKLLPKGSDLIKISLELYLNTMNIQVPNPIKKSVPKESINNRIEKQQEDKPEPVKKDTKQNITIDDDMDIDVTVI